MLTKLYVKARTLMVRDDEGATAAEYGILVGLIAVAIILGVGALGTNLGTLFNNVATRIGNVTVPGLGS